MSRLDLVLDEGRELLLCLLPYTAAPPGFQLDAAVPNFLIQERGDNEYADLLAKPLPPVVGGYRGLLTDPGLGITIDENKLMSQVGEPRPYVAQFDKDDGSVVDW